VSELASVVKLSPSTRAVLVFHGSGRLLSLHFLRGREAWTLDDREAQKLADALAERVPVESVNA
jgi:hypothetical protein